MSYIFPQHHPQQVDIWCLSELDKLPANLDLLSTTELARANRLQFAQHKKRFIIAHDFLRQVLSLYLPIQAQQIVFQQSKLGKPMVQDHALQFNLSHSYDKVICAVSYQVTVGIDIEKIRPKPFIAFAKRFLHPEEWQILQQTTEQQRAKMFFTIWTQKEAWLKAQGQGLRGALNQFAVAASEPGGLLSPKISQQSLQTLAVAQPYIAALATDHPQPKLVWQDHNKWLSV